MAALALGSCVTSLPTVAAADSVLAPSASDLVGAGLHPVAASTAGVTAALESGLPRSLRAAVARGPAGAAAGARGDEHAAAGAFVLGSTGIAHRVLTAWRRAHRATGLLAHEVFHCFEFSLTPTVWDKVGAWVREGT